MTLASMIARTSDRQTTELKSKLYQAREAAIERLEKGTASLSGERFTTTDSISIRIYVRPTDSWTPGTTSLNIEMAEAVRSVVNMAIGAARWHDGKFTYDGDPYDQRILVTIIADLTPSS